MYILTPRDPVDLGLLVDTLRANPKPSDLDVVIGVKGVLAPPEICNGLMVPLVSFDQIYFFDRDTFIKEIPRHDGIAAKEFAPAAEELFDRIILMTDNAGSTNEHRAMNYLAMRYPPIYGHAAEAFARNESLTGVDVTHSQLSGGRTIVDVVFAYTNRTTDVVDKVFARVDVTEEFPFLVTRLSAYYDHNHLR